MKQIVVIISFSILAKNGIAQKVFLNLPYTTNAVKEQQFDLYIPATQNFTTILYIHEGSLTGGDKDDAPYPMIAKKFQDQGICFANMNYRLGQDNKWPAQPDDAASAIRWLKDSIAVYGGNANKIFVFGHSSGALLAALIGTDESYLAKKKLKLSDIAGVIAAGTQLIHHIDSTTREKTEAAFAANGYLRIFGNTVVFNNASPMAHINNNMPRFLILVAEQEQFQPPILEQAKEFVEKSKQLHVNASYQVVPGRTHMTAITQMVNEQDIVFDIVKGFVMK